MDKVRYQYRIYPTQSQEHLLAKAFGCARVVWNDALALCHEAYKNGESFPKDLDKKVITQAKKTEERAWLAEVSNIVLQQSYRDLQQAWSNFFKSLKGERKGKKIRPPRFKKKKSRQSIRFRIGGFSVHSNSVKLAKIGHIKTIYSRPLSSPPTSVTIIKEPSGRYYASFVVEPPEVDIPETNQEIGVDLGLAHFCILSTGEKIDNPRFHKRLLRKIKQANRKLSRCQKGSKRREKARLKLAKLHERAKDRRTDFLHKLTTRLVCENKAIAIEDLNVSGMQKNRKLSRAISDAGWRKFRDLLTTKCNKYGRKLVVVNRWEATSQKCSHCGFRGGKKTLDVREWTCLNCDKHHDRDVCAAENIANHIKFAVGHTETINGRGSKCKTTSVAVCDEPSTTYKQLSLF